MIFSLMALALAVQQPGLRPELEPLRFLVGHCWRGEIQPGRQDTHCFESVYDGQHVRDRHQVTGGTSLYSGETLYSWDGAAGAVTYTYWNSLGGVSRGTMRPEPDRLDFGDETYSGPEGQQVSYSTFWRALGDNAYEAVTLSAESPTLNRSVRYQRVDLEIAISSSRNADGSHNLVHETLVAAPIDQVWEAISTAPGWTSWAVPVAWMDGDILETSYSPAAAPGDPSTIRQRIDAIVPGRLLAFRTVKAPEGFPHFDTFRFVSHLLELEPVDGGTRVRLTGSGYADTEAGRQLLGFFREGNRVSLDRLRRRFSDGPVDWARELGGDNRSGL